MQRRIPARAFSFEYIMWLFMRISGLGMSILALIGVAYALYIGARTQMDLGTLLRWTFFPISTHVASADIAVLEQWANPFWSIMQYLLILFAISHAFNGLRMVVEDYMGSGWGTILFRGLLFLLWLFALFIAFNIIQSSGAL